MRSSRFALRMALAAGLAWPAVAGATVDAWQQLGPQYATTSSGNQLTGIVYDLDAHTHRVLGFYGGLWGFSVVPYSISNSLPAQLDLYTTFASPPSDANTILVGMGYGATFKTNDGGSTWSTVSVPGSPSHIYRIRYSPDGSIIHLACDLGYLRSTDGGATWTPGNGSVPAMTDLCTTIGMPNTLFGTFGRFGQLSLYRSDDAGVNWQPVSTLAPASATNGAVSAIATAGTVHVFASFDGNVWRSADNGATWQKVASFGDLNLAAVSICPSDPNIVLTGDQVLKRSTDGGLTWSIVTSSFLHSGYNVFGWEDNGTGVWAGTRGGWFHSGDQGQSWDASSNVMPIATLDQLDCERTEAGVMLGGTHGSNVLVTPNESLLWSDAEVGGGPEFTAGPVALDQFMPQRMWVCAPSAHLYRSSNDGVTWTATGTGLPGSNGVGGYMANDDAPSPHLFWGQGNFVYESADTGLTFAQSNPSAFPNSIFSLASSQRVSGGAVLYVTLSGLSGSRLYVRDGGTWVDRSSGLPAGQLIKAVPHPWAADANEAWTFMAGPNRIFHTIDRGVTWTDITGDFPSLLALNDLMPNPNHPGEVYAATIQGCWRTLNGGVNWEPWLNGMPTYGNATQLAYIDQTASGGPFSVVAAVRGRSVWKRDASGSDPQPSISVSNASCAEGNSGTTSLTFQLTLTGAPVGGLPAKVDYATADGSALAGSDYQAASGTATFPYGQNTTTVTVLVNGDTAIEPDETFTLTLSNPVRATIATGTATGTIEDDDARGLVDQSVPAVDGTVNALVLSGDSLFVGGAFHHLGTATGSAVPFDSTSGQPVWLPKVAGTVQAVASDGAGGWYLGGVFTDVGGFPRQNLAHVLADHSVASWNPAPNGIVFALAVSDGVLYVGGGFTTMGAITRNDLAAFDSAGNLTAWDPEADGTVVTLAMGTNVVYAGGDFTHVGGAARARLAALDATTGAASAWNPGANDEVASFVRIGSTLYVGGNFDTLATQVRHKLAAVDATTGALGGWNPGADGEVYTLVTNGTTVFAGGAFATIMGQSRSYVAAIDPATGAPTGWNAGADQPVLALALSGSTLYAGGTFLNIGGHTRGQLAAVDVTTGLARSWDPEPNAAVVALALQGGVVMAGGAFDMLGAQARANLAAISVSTGQVLGWNPGTDGTVNALALSGHTLYVGGTFANLGGQPRARIGAVDAGTGLATSFNPGANARVWTLLPVGGAVVAGGQFTIIGGVARNAIAAISTSTGATTTWNPNANGTVAALAFDGGSVLYAGGAFTGIGGAARSGLAALSTSTGAAITTWNPAPNAGVTALLYQSGSLVVAGAFTTIAGVGRGRAAILNSNGTVATWNPGADGAINAFSLAGSTMYVGGLFGNLGGSVQRHHLGAVTLSNSVTNWPPEPNNTVNALVTVGNVVWAGGSFTAVAGLPQAHLARLIPVSGVDAPGPAASPSTTLALDIGPNPTHGALRVRYTLASAARVRIGVYDVLGRRIGAEIEQLAAPGAHDITWAGADGRGHAPAGLYFVRLESAGRQAVRRFAVVR